MTSPTYNDRTRMLLAALAVGALTLPFLARPFHIDDEVYLRGAEQILLEPLDPLGGTQKMLGAVMPTYRFTQHPPLVSALLAAVIRVTGDVTPWQLHAAFLVFPLIAVLAMLRLAKRFVEHPLAAALLLVATPAFVVSSHGLMTDVPHLALCLVACAAFVSGVDDDKRGPLVVAGAALALACLTQYRALVFVPVFLAYAWFQRRPLLPVAHAVLPSLVVLALWSWWNQATLGVLHILDAGGTIPLTAERVLRDAIAYVSFIGGATVFPLFLAFVVRRRLRLLAIWGCIVPLVGLIVWRWAPDHRGVEGFLLAAFCTVGLATVIGLVPDGSAWRRQPSASWARAQDGRDDVFLFAAACIVLASQVVLNLFASVRSLQAALPFLVLLPVRRLEREAASEAQARRQLAAGVVATAILGVAVAAGDYALAVAHRDLAADVRCHHEGCRVWYSGEWGFRYAMARRGHEYLVTADNSALAGDVVVMPDVPCPADLHPALVARLQLVEAVDSEERFPIKLTSFRDHAAFYSNFFGLLPYSFSHRPLDRIRVFRVAEDKGGATQSPIER